MESRSYSLCPNCDACPEVVLAPEWVTIGEAGNQVRLSAEEWNVLVEAIKAGELAEVGAEALNAKRGDCGCGCEGGCCA